MLIRIGKSAAISALGTAAGMGIGLVSANLLSTTSMIVSNIGFAGATASSAKVTSYFANGVEITKKAYDGYRAAHRALDTIGMATITVSKVASTKVLRDSNKTQRGD